MSRNRIARINTDLSLDAFNPNVNIDVTCTAIDFYGRIYIGGVFTSVGGQSRSYIARLNADGTLDAGFNPSLDGSPLSMAVQANQKIVIVGTFTTVNGQSRNYIARLNTDGTLDTGFTPTVDDWPTCITLCGGNQLVVGGYFVTINGQSRSHIAILNLDGTLDTQFAPQVNSSVFSVAVDQSTWRVIIGGFFTSVNGQSRNYIARLDTNGVLDTFHPNISDYVKKIALQSDGKIVVGGSTSLLIRLNTDGTQDTSFNATVNDKIYDIAIQADGKLLVGGLFTSISGQAIKYLSRLNTNGFADTGFNLNLNSSVECIAIQSDGKIVFGGDFIIPDTYFSTLSDTITISDQETNQAGKGLSESAALSDDIYITLNGGPVIMDSASLSDQVNTQVGKGLDDSASLSDSEINQAGKGLSDTASLSDSETNQAGKGINDSASLAETLYTKLLSPFDQQTVIKVGSSPVWILKCPFATGTLYLSDRTFPVPAWNSGITTKPWISTWNAIDEDISGEMAMTKVSDLSLNMRIDPKAATTIQDILWDASNNIETTDCELYLWFEGSDVSIIPPRLMWVGNIIDHEKLDELLVRVDFIDQSVRIDKYVGNKLDLVTYTSCDPDDVGKVAPIIYGAVTKVPALAVDAGAQTSLPNTINSTVTSFTVSDGSRLAAGKVIQIDDEQIYISGISGDTVTNCTRGYNTTLGATHWRGASVWEKKTQFVYLWADHAVKSIGKILGKVGQAELDITSICTKYTGQAGNQLAGYGAKGVITIPGYITVEQAIDLWVNDGIGVSDSISINDAITILDAIGVLDTIGISDLMTIIDGIAVNDTISVSDLLSIVDSIGVSDTISVSDTIAVSDTIGVNDSAITDNIGAADNIGVTVGGSTKTIYPSSASPSGFGDGNDADSITIAPSGLATAYFASTSYGTIDTQYIWAKIAAGPWTVLGGWSPSTISPSGAGWYRFSRSGGNWGDTFQLQNTSASNSLVYECRKEVDYTPSASKTGGAYRTGASLSKAAASKSGSASKTGNASKSGGASKTGTADRSGSISKAGSASKGGTVNRSGSISKAGGASKTGTVDRSGSVARSGSVTKTGTVTLAGNSVANTLVGDEILISGEGWQDDASGTYTGTANALIERPDHVIKHFLNVYGGWPVANFYTTAGSNFVSKNYKFAGVINEYKRLKEWLAYFSWQCRCYFRLAGGQAQLLYRPDTIASSRIITKNMIRMDSGTKKTTLRGPRPSPLEQVINKINLHFDRDWDQTGENAYKGISKDSTSASITKYGEKEKPELFYFDFVTSQAMADDVRGFYLARYAYRKKDYNMEVFLDNVDAKFADGVTIQPAANLLAEVEKVNIYPGSGRDKRNDKITLYVRGY